MELGHTHGSPNLGQKTRLNDNQQKEESLQLNEREKKDKYLDLARELKKTMEHEDDNYTNCNGCV